MSDYYMRCGCGSPECEYCNPTPADKSPLDKLDHPCRDTCSGSGWQQGYNKAYLAVKQEMDNLLHERSLYYAQFDQNKNYCDKLQQELDAARAEVKKTEEHWMGLEPYQELVKQLADAQLETEKLKKNFSEVNEIFERRQTTLRDALERILQFRGHADIHSIAKKALEDSV